MTKRIVFLLITSLLLFALSACQPTPNREKVQDKDENLLEMIQEDSENAAANIKSLNGDGWVDEITIPSEKVQLFIDATIHTQEVDEYPIIRVKSSETGTVAFKNALDYFLAGIEVYYWTEYTKEDIAGKLIELNKELLLSTDDGRTDGLEEQINYYTAEYETAPSKLDDIPFNIADDPNGDIYRSITGYDGIVLKAYLDNGFLAGLNSEKGGLYYGLIDSNIFSSNDTESNRRKQIIKHKYEY